MNTTIETTEIARAWNRLSDSEKLEIIQDAIDYCDTSQGFLMLRFWRKEESVTGHIAKDLVNHLCVEAVSQDTLISLFGENYDYQPEDAEVILNWMASQK